MSNRDARRIAIFPWIATWIVSCAAALPATPSVAFLPGDSLYQLPMQLTLQDGTQRSWESLRGKPVVITMFYASCNGVCPTIALTLRNMEAALEPAKRDGVQWLMVSFDPQHDTPPALRNFAALNRIDRPHWFVARVEEASVRNLAAALGARYRPLPGGGFNHSTVITLLDADGVIRARTSNLDEPDADFVRALGQELH